MSDFNTRTDYVVAYLELVTMHRPTKQPFGFITHFDFVTGIATIKDKGAMSSRCTFLPPSAVHLLRNYKSYLINLSSRLTHTAPKIAEKLTRALEGEVKLFRYWYEDKLTRYKPNKKYQEIQKIAPVIENWPRHFLKTKLLILGVYPDDVKRYMGHASEHDNLYSIVGTFDANKFKELAELIENDVIKPLNIPLLNW
jgi:integrase